MRKNFKHAPTDPGELPGSVRWEDREEAMQRFRETPYCLSVASSEARADRILVYVTTVLEGEEGAMPAAFGEFGDASKHARRHRGSTETDETERLSMKSVYIAGPMRGIEDWNYPLFDEARDFLNRLGKWQVFSPADMDRAQGFNPVYDEVDPVLFMRDAMRRDLTKIAECDRLAVLPGWENSKGCKAEIALARVLNIPIMHLFGAKRVEDTQVVL